MFIKELKKLSFHRLIGSFILLLAILGGILALFGTSFLNLIAGPKHFYSLPTENLQGQYVNLDRIYMVGSFAETVKSSNNFITEEVTERYYILAYDSQTVIAIKFDENDLKDAELLYSDAATAEQLRSILPLYGTIDKMDSEELEYYYDWFADDEYYGALNEHELRQYALPYVLVVNEVGMSSKGIVIGAMVIFVLLLALLLNILIKWMRGGYQKSVLKFLEEHPLVTSEELKEEFDHAKISSYNLKIGAKYAFYIDGATVVVIPITEIIWAYGSIETNKNGKTYLIKLITAANATYSISMKNEAEMQSMVNYFKEMKFSMVVGYSKELEAIYQSDFEGFRDFVLKLEAE